MDFRLLPRWAIAVLALRELAMLVLGRYGLTRGVELRINWPGRLAVAPVMVTFFVAVTETAWLLVEPTGVCGRLAATATAGADDDGAAKPRTWPSRVPT